MPKVSIIVPVYNVEQYIDKCLHSLICQTLEDIQIIIVNDGSTDKSYQIIEKYLKMVTGKIVYVEKKNGGLSDARNEGMKYVTGEYIGFVDGDDFVEPDMYEKMYCKAKKEDADMAECDFWREYTGGRLKRDNGCFYTTGNMLVYARVMVWNKIIKRFLLEKTGIVFPVGLRYEDIEFFYKLVPRIKSVVFVKYPLYHYFQRDGSLSRLKDRKTEDVFLILDNVLEFYKAHGFYEDYKDQLEYVYTRYLLGSSFLRIAGIDDNELRNDILDETWDKLRLNFPEWKKNIILRNSKSLKNTYFKTINAFTYKLYSKIFAVAIRAIFR